jgi:hypothetical protein
MPTIAEEKQTPYYDFSDAEKEQRTLIINSAIAARNQKQQNYIEFDDMDYETWYYKAKKASQAYIKPKENDEDVRVVTGTTREKGNALINTFLNYNLEADVSAFDENAKHDISTGNMMTKLVRKSRQLELPDYEYKRPIIYSELVHQGNVFLRERWLQYKVPSKTKTQGKWSKKMSKIYEQCDSLFLTGLQVYPGNIRNFFLELQPFLVTRTVITYDEGRAAFKDEFSARWEYVPSSLRQSPELLETAVRYDDFQMISTEGNFVEVLEYFNKWTNTYQMMLNGMPMFEVDFPLSELTGIC